MWWLILACVSPKRDSSANHYSVNRNGRLGNELKELRIYSPSPSILFQSCFFLKGSFIAFIQWNLDVKKGQGTGNICTRFRYIEVIKAGCRTYPNHFLSSDFSENSWKLLLWWSTTCFSNSTVNIGGQVYNGHEIEWRNHYKKPAANIGATILQNDFAFYWHLKVRS